jgi:DNA mismatch repair protein MutS
MQQGLEPVARELDKEGRSLREKIGARRLKNALNGLAADGEVGLASCPRGEERALSGPEPGQVRDVSLLWPTGGAGETARLYEESIRDLGVQELAAALAEGRGEEGRSFASRVLCELCLDPEVLCYRQDVLADLLRYPELASGLQELLPRIEDLALESMPSRETTELFQIAWWLGILETYVECVEAAAESFGRVDGELSSRGLRLLREQIIGIQNDPTFRSLVRELPGLLSRVRGVLSITVGINLTPDLLPESATLLSVNDQQFTEAPLLKALLGNAGDYEAVMPLHSVPLFRGDKGGGAPNPMLIPLFRDLSKVMSEATKPAAEALRRYVRLSYHMLGRLRPELAFYIGAAELVRRMEAAGLAMCRPELAPRGDRLCVVREGFNLNLALRLLAGGQADGLADVIVRNDVVLDSKGRIAVLTGPNQGGKTTYAQGVGLIQVLAQVGLYVPGTTARLSPADNVYTHFPVEEELGKGTGRFGDEAKRLGEIFQKATDQSLILLNEPLSGTYPGESLYLARDVLRIFRQLGARVILTTHMHELAAQVDDLNRETSGDSPIVSLVSSRIEREPAPTEVRRTAVERTYRVVESPPMGRSYARELAMLYGISYEQLVDLLRERGLLKPGADGDV